MKKTINNNGAIRLVPSNENDWLYDGVDSFGKVVDCPESTIDKWQEVANAFKVEWEEQRAKEMEEESWQK